MFDPVVSTPAPFLEPWHQHVIYIPEFKKARFRFIDVNYLIYPDYTVFSSET